MEPKYNAGEVVEFTTGELEDEDDLDSVYRYHGKIVKVLQAKNGFFYIVVTALSAWVLPEAAIYLRFVRVDTTEKKVGSVLSLHKVQEEDVNE